MLDIEQPPPSIAWRLGAALPFEGFLEAASHPKRGFVRAATRAKMKVLGRQRLGKPLWIGGKLCGEHITR